MSTPNTGHAGGEEERDAIADAAGECIKAHLLHDSVEVRTAALWVIINLTEGCDIRLLFPLPLPSVFEVLAVDFPADKQMCQQIAGNATPALP